MRVRASLVLSSLFLSGFVFADHDGKEEVRAGRADVAIDFPAPAAITGMSFPIFCSKDPKEKRSKDGAVIVGETLAFEMNSKGVMTVSRKFSHGIEDFKGICEIKRPNRPAAEGAFENPTQDMTVVCDVKGDEIRRVELTKKGSTGELTAVATGSLIGQPFTMKWDGCYEENVNVFTEEQTTNIFERALACANKYAMPGGTVQAEPSGVLAKGLGRRMINPIEYQNILYSPGRSNIRKNIGQVLPEKTHLRKLKSSVELCEEIKALVDAERKNR